MEISVPGGNFSIRSELRHISTTLRRSTYIQTYSNSSIRRQNTESGLLKNIPSGTIYQIKILSQLVRKCWTAAMLMSKKIRHCGLRSANRIALPLVTSKSNWLQRYGRR